MVFGLLQENLLGNCIYPLLKEHKNCIVKIVRIIERLHNFQIIVFFIGVLC